MLAKPKSGFITKILTNVDSIPQAKFPIKTEIYNEKGELINSGETILAFFNAVTNKPIAAPKFFIDEMTRIFRMNESSNSRS